MTKNISPCAKWIDMVQQPFDASWIFVYSERIFGGICSKSSKNSVCLFSQWMQYGDIVERDHQKSLIRYFYSNVLLYAQDDISLIFTFIMPSYLRKRNHINVWIFHSDALIFRQMIPYYIFVKRGFNVLRILYVRFFIQQEFYPQRKCYVMSIALIFINI